MGTWDRRSQWCNRLLWINVILGGRFFVVGKGEREGKGGDGARLAFEEVIRRQGAGHLYWLSTPTQAYPAPANRHSTALRQWRKHALLSLENSRGRPTKGE